MRVDMLKQSLRDDRVVMEYQVQMGEMMDGLVLKQCKENGISGILPMGASYEDGHNYMYAYIDKKETYAQQLMDTVTQELMLTSFESMVHTMVTMEEQGINLAYLVLDTEKIYMNEDSLKVKLICMPGKSASMEKEEIPNFFRSILANAVYLNSEDGNYVAKLLTALNKEFDLQSFLREIHGLMRDAGIEIIEEKVVEPTPVVAEPVAPPVIEPVVAEPVAPPVVEPVVAEPVAPPVVEPVVAPPPVMGVIQEDEIEFEPMPEEMNAKIERMNAQPAEPEPVAPVPPVAPPVESQPTAPVPPVAPPVEPQPTAPVPPVAPPVEPQPAAPVPPVAPPVEPQPTTSVPPVMPQPQILPQDIGLQQPQKVRNPHLVRVKTGETIPLGNGEFVIGKSLNGVNYTITDNSAVSRVHCTIIERNGAYYVRDEKSTNSTYVNGERVLPGTEKLLLNGCKLHLGDEEFSYSLW